MNAAPFPDRKPSPTVMVLDDDDALRGAAVRALARNGYRVLTAASAAEALQMASGWVGPIDLLLCDLVLPGLGGREAASILLARRPEMEVIFTSGFRTHGSFRKDLDRPGMSFLAKPFQVPELLEAVAAVLDGRCWPGVEAQEEQA